MPAEIDVSDNNCDTQQKTLVLRQMHRLEIRVFFVVEFVDCRVQLLKELFALRFWQGLLYGRCGCKLFVW